MQRIRRLYRYLKGHKSVIQLYERPKMPKMMKYYGDSDHADDAEWRRSTVGQVIMLSIHIVVNELTQMELSSAEKDYNSGKKLRVVTDDSSKKAFVSNRVWIDRTRFLYQQIQER